MINPGISLSALSAFTTGVQGAAYNIANVNTPAFQPVSVRYQSGPRGDGVQPVVSRQSAPAASVTEATANAMGAAPGTAPLPPPSNVNMALEMTGLINNQRAFEANAAVIRTSDDMLGLLVDIRV